VGDKEGQVIGGTLKGGLMRASDIERERTEFENLYSIQKQH